MFNRLTIEQLKAAIKYYNENFSYTTMENKHLAEQELDRRLKLIENAKRKTKVLWFPKRVSQ